MSSDKSLVSIIVRTKDRPMLLRVALRSIAAQDHRPIEVVLVNDGGCNLDIGKIAESLGDVPFQYVRYETSRGRVAAGNEGILKARGRYIGFLDDDDEFCGDHLSTLVSSLDADGVYKVAYADSEIVFKEVDAETGESRVRERRVFASYDFSYIDLLVGNYIPLISLLFSDKILKETGGFDEGFDLYEDWDLLLRIGRQYPFRHINKVTSMYNQWDKRVQIAQAAEPQVIDKAFARIIQKHLHEITPEVILNLRRKEESLSNELRDLIRKFNDRESELSRSYAEIRRKDAEILGKNEEIRRKDDELLRIAADLEQKYQELRQASSLLSQKELETERLRDENTRINNAIVEIQSTLGWRLLNKARDMRDKALPPGTGRWELYRKAADRIKKEKTAHPDLAELPVPQGTAEPEEEAPAEPAFAKAAIPSKDDVAVKESAGSAERGRLEEDIQTGVACEESEAGDYESWIHENEPGAADFPRQREEARAFLFRPLISIVVPVFETDREMLVSMLESVVSQTYDNWQLCIADGNSAKPHIRRILEAYSQKDPRIKVRFLWKNLGIAGNSNEAISLADGEFIGFLDHDDELAPFALYEAARYLNENPSADFIYSDEDKIDSSGKRFWPFFKPGWSPDLLLSVNYICHFALLRRTLIEDLGGFRRGYEGAQDYDLFLRAGRATSRIAHIPKVLYHWRDHESSTATDVSRKEYADESGIAALTDFLKSGHIDAYVEPGFVKTNYTVRYALAGRPLISIIIPFRDKVGLLRRCIESILEKTTYEKYELLLVSNQSREDETFRYLDEAGRNERVRVLTFDEEFNYAKINNYAVRFSRGDFLLFLNNDTEVLEGDWLTFLLEHAQRKEIGAVGCKLLFPDRTIQHAGVVVGITGFAGHVFAGLPEHTYNYFGSADFVRDFLAVTAACLMVRREVFDEVGGLNESFIVCGNDVDFCLRICGRGYRNVYTPHAVLLHHEAASRGACIPSVDFRLSLESYEKYLHMRDPYYNPNLTLLKTDCSLRQRRERDALEHIRDEAIQWANVCNAGTTSRERQESAGETMAMVEAFDYSVGDLQTNRRLMVEFEKDRPSIESINWFIPDFAHVYYGGIYTISRFASYFSGKGIKNRFVLYDSPHALESAVSGKIRAAFPEMEGFEVFVRRGADIDIIPYADISIATLWTSAYRLLKFTKTRGKFYFIQDYEPLFYPAGTSYGLAEATYRFGFHGIVNSPGLHNFISGRYDMRAEYFVPAVDHNIFFPGDRSARGEGQTLRLFIYGRPQHDRNAFELAMAAAKRIKAALGSRIEIVSAGSEWNAADYGVGGGVENLGLISYRETAELYRRSDFGLVLMFTKHTSYLPLELMASGSVVITNYNDANTWLLKDGINCVIVEPSPTYIAEKLVGLISEPALQGVMRENAIKTTASGDWTLEMEKILRFITGGN